VLRSRVHGEKERIHDHYLKSTVYCGKCGARLIIHNAKSASGGIYPYFVCVAKHNKRNGCRQRSLLIGEVEHKIEELYEQISFKPEFRELLQQWITDQIDRLADKKRGELEQLRRQREKLDREQRKLLEAHYADAIPLHLLEEEQDRISKALGTVSAQITAHEAEHSETLKNLNDVFELLDNCGWAYKMANDYERRCFNQAIFNRILVFEDLTLEPEYSKHFCEILISDLLKMKNKFQKMTSFIKIYRLRR